MNRGDLRRFKDDAHFPAAASENFTGQPFVVLTIVGRVPGRTSGRVDVLVGGKVRQGWGYPWVEQNSEVISEAR
jgi:hypothetical protein